VSNASLKMGSLKKTVLTIILIGALLICVPIILYFEHFGDNGYALNVAEWGQFGDFIGGTINPIIGIVNLGILIAISIYVAKFDHNRDLNGYRHKIYIELCTKFDETQANVNGLMELMDYLEIYCFNNQFLFSKRSNEIFNLVVKDLIDKLVAIEEEYEDGLKNGTIQIREIPMYLGRALETLLKSYAPTETEEDKATREFSASKKRILGFIQAVMIEKDIEQFAKNN